MKKEHPSIRAARKEDAATDTVLEALARQLHTKRNGARECPAVLIPTADAIAVWVAKGNLPDADSLRECASRLRALSEVSPDLPDLPAGDGVLFNARVASAPDGSGDVWLSGGPAVAMWTVEADGAFRAMMGEVGSRETTRWVPFGDIHAIWVRTSNRPSHPFAPYVEAWQEGARTPVEVRPDRRRDRGIVPAITLGRTDSAREAGMRFGVRDGPGPGQIGEIPLFPEIASEKRVPLLDVVDAAGVPLRARQGGAALESRLFVHILMSVRHKERRFGDVRLAITLRELRDGLFPNGWKRSQDLPRLRQALMTARDYAIRDAKGRWWPIALRYMPDEPTLDDMIVLDLAFPPGSASGPVVDQPAIERLSVKSAPRWRAALAAPSVAWIPGVTRVPAPRAGGRFVWSRNRDAYPVLTFEDRRRLAFGLDDRDRRNRTRAEMDAAWRNLPGLRVVDRQAIDRNTGETGWLILPCDAADAIAGGPDTAGTGPGGSGGPHRRSPGHGTPTG